MDQLAGGASGSGGNRGRAGQKQKKVSTDEFGLNSEKLAQVEKESCKCAMEMNHGIIIEALKNFMFTQSQTSAPAL